MAVAEETGKDDKKGTSMVVQIAVLLVMTAATAGVGWLTGDKLGAESAEETKTEAHAGGAPEAHGEEGEDEEDETAARPEVYPLEPITINLAAPNSVWARLEVSLVFEGAPNASVADKVHQDLIGYMRTVKLDQVESASGFQHLKADFEERARLRSDGSVRQVLIKTLLFE